MRSFRAPTTSSKARTGIEALKEVVGKYIDRRLPEILKAKAEEK